MPDGDRVVYSVRDYCVRREIGGALKETILRDSKTFGSLSDDLQQAVEANGIDYAYLAIAPDTYTQANIQAFDKLFKAMKKPILMFCRTGNRAVNLWGLSQITNHGKAYVCNQANNIGFDISATVNAK